jgi:hypothetical protein
VKGESSYTLKVVCEIAGEIMKYTWPNYVKGRPRSSDRFRSNITHGPPTSDRTDSGIDTWSDEVCHSVEKWLARVASGAMAYFLREDGGATQLLSEFEPDLVDAYLPLPKNVQRTDSFRILVSKSISRIVRTTFLVFSWEDVVKFLLYSERTSVCSCSLITSTRIWTLSLFDRQQPG